MLTVWTTDILSARAQRAYVRSEPLAEMSGLRPLADRMSALRHSSSRDAKLPATHHGPNRWRYSLAVMNALTISALAKSPLN
jgi:hypothetical protein